MPQPFPAIARLRQAVPGCPPPTDAELLARFAASRDEDSFRELVRRHGPLVLAVCRRVTGNREDADDAFQAALLVLARRADRVRSGSPLGGWLYGVAVRVARKAAARAIRRRSRETALVEPIDVPDRPPPFDPETIRAVLDEVARLSDAYRAAVVLCELEGRSRSAAALELGIAEGTLSSRLAAARKVLARRFRDRGLAPTVLAAVAGSASCPVLAADAARLAGASASPAPHIVGLSEAVMRTGFLSYRVFAPVAALLAVVALVVNAADPEPPRPAVEEVAVQQPAPTGTILLRELDRPRERYRFTTLTPDGKSETEFATPKDWPETSSNPYDALRSPDGKWVAFDLHPRVSGNLNPKKFDDPEAEAPDEVEFAVVVVGIDGKNPRTIRSVKTKKPFSVQLHVIDWR